MYLKNISTYFTLNLISVRLCQLFRFKIETDIFYHEKNVFKTFHMRSAYFGGAAVAGVVLARTAAVVGAAVVASAFRALMAVMLHPAVVSGDLGVITTLLIDVPSPIQATKASAVMRPMFPPFHNIHVYTYYMSVYYKYDNPQKRMKIAIISPLRPPFFGWLYFFEKIHK